MRRYLLLICIALIVAPAYAQLYTLSGKITNQQNKPVAFASVYIKNSTYGTDANENGNYQLKLSPGSYNVVYRFVGFKERIENITIFNHDEQRNVQMEDERFQLKEVSKGSAEDPGIEIMRQVIKKRKYYLNEVKAYTCAVYIKGEQKLVSAPKKLLGQDVASALSLDSNRKGILYQSESLSTFSFQEPDKIKEELIASKAEGQNTAFSYNKASDLQVNFYKNLFVAQGLSSHGFISPASENGLFYYDYKLLGFKIENGVTVDKIQVIPKRQHDLGFTGNIYIIDGDWRIYGVDLLLTDKANHLNLIDTLHITQQYVPIKDNVWQPLSTQYNFNGKVLGFKFEGYYLGIYNNYNLSPAFPPHYFNGEIMRVDTFSNKRDSAYWQKIRPVPLTTQEANDYRKRDKIAAHKETEAYLDSIQHTKNEILVLPYLVFGYSATNRSNKDSLYLYPFLQTVFYNTVEGFGVNLKVKYSKTYDDLSSFSITPNVRYGFADKLFNANVEAEYIYDPARRAKFFGGFGSNLFDLNNVGTRSLYFNTLSTLLSERNYVKYYRSQYGNIGYQREIANGIVWKSSLTYDLRTQLFNNSYYTFSTYKDRRLTSNNPLMPDAPANDRSFLFPQTKALTFNTSFTFIFDQQYITRPTGRVYEPSRYPSLTINYRKGINSVLGSDVDYDFASAQLSKDHFLWGLIGYSSFRLTVGDFFNHNKLYFMDYNHFLGNQGTTFDPAIGSFHFLPFYTYSTSGGFVEAHFEHNFSGYVFNKIPFVKKLKLEEIVGVNYLTEKNNPNYSEFYVGLQRLIFRVDYGISFAGNKRYLQGFRIFYGIR